MVRLLIEELHLNLRGWDQALQHVEAYELFHFLVAEGYECWITTTLYPSSHLNGLLVGVHGPLVREASYLLSFWEVTSSIIQGRKALNQSWGVESTLNPFSCPNSALGPPLMLVVLSRLVVCNETLEFFSFPKKW